MEVNFLLWRKCGLFQLCVFHTGFLQTEISNFEYNGESNLDLEYAMALVTPAQNVTLYQIGDDVEGASFVMVMIMIIIIF